MKERSSGSWPELSMYLHIFIWVSLNATIYLVSSTPENLPIKEWRDGMGGLSERAGTQCDFTKKGTMLNSSL
jgi:hypothetical protein